MNKEWCLMRQAWFLLATLILLASVANAKTAAPARFTVKTTAGEIIVESFEGGSGDSRPAVLILSGSKGFGAPAYDEIGEWWSTGRAKAPDELSGWAQTSCPCPF